MHWKKKMTYVFLGVMVCPISVLAQVYDLNPVVVTANREIMSEMETPASVQVIEKDKIESIGARNIYEAMRMVPGVYFNGWGAKGIDFGDHNTTLSVRGVDQGASVLLNGIPVAANNFTQLSSIDISSVERIEVVKGAAAVLYGPETMTGVINIITRNGNSSKPEVMLEGGWGSRGNKDFRINYSDNRFQVGYTKEYIGAYAPTTDVYYGWYTDTDVYGHRKSSTKENIYVSAKLSKAVSFLYNRFMSKPIWGETASDEAERLTHSYDDIYRVRGDHWLVMYDQNGIKGKAFYSDRTSNLYNRLWDGTGSSSDEDYKTKRYGFDLQKNWYMDERHRFIAGMMAEKEKYTELVGSHKGDRTQYALYGQYTVQVNDRYKNIFGLRYQYSSDQVKTYNEWIPQWQQLYSLSSDEVIYTNIGKSFILPRIYDYFYTVAAVDLKPECGWNYELGYKKNFANGYLRVSSFYIDVDNKIKVVKETPKKKIKNVGRFKNPGIEIEYGHIVNDAWNWNVGLTYANPKNKLEDGTWEQTFPKLQCSAGITYKKDKLDSSLTLQCAAKRPHQIKNYLDLSFHAGYKVSKTDYFAIDVYNVLNRRDVTTEYDWISYYGDTRTVVVRYRHTFG